MRQHRYLYSNVRAVMQLGTVHLSQACSSHRLIVKLLEEFTRECLEVFKEQLVHLASMC